MAEVEDLAGSLEGLSAAQLMEKKETIEKDIKEFDDILQTSGVGLKGPLVDRDGYPRSDIDVYAVRVARNKIICLQNDYKAVMSAMEEKLHHLHAVAKATQSEHAHELVPQERGELLGKGFAKVNSVAQGSPADLAGLQVGDVMTEFGSVNHNSFKSLQDIGTVVQHSRGKPVRVVVNRKQKQLPLSLTPQQWGGRGLLGCNIVPM